MDPVTDEKHDEKRGIASASLDNPPEQMSTYIRPQYRKPHDPDVTFEEYFYYAQKTREEELTLEAPKIQWREFFSRKKTTHTDVDDPNATAGQIPGPDTDGRLEITDEEWANASRLFRTASTGACKLPNYRDISSLALMYQGFYLITTDILGPYGVGFALGTLGWGPGVALFTVFGFMAGYSGYLIRHVYLGLDSYQFPIRNYGDLGFRTWGTTARHVTNVMQTLGLLLILGQVTIQYGMNISQVSKFKLCYAVCPVIFVCIGFFLTQIRTLKAYGWAANFSVWITLLAIFISMGVIANSPPNYPISVLGSAGSAVDPTTIAPDKNGVYPPIIHYSKLPPNSLVGSINGLLQGVLAYAGAQLFVEFMAEMRRPRDFITAMWGAQFFIYTVYLVYGCFVYHYQGQYSFQPSYQGVSSYGWQTVGNILTLIAAWIAAGLYGNIGIKVLYNNILVDILKAPLLTTTKGKWIYAGIVPIWWGIAFVIAAAIPDYFGFVSIISASMLLNLTYTLPPFFAVGFDIQANAMRADAGEGFDPSTGHVNRVGSTVGRWARGFVSGGPIAVARNVFNVFYFLCSLVMCGLGMYAAVEGLITAFQIPQLNSFSCVSPLDLSAHGG